MSSNEKWHCNFKDKRPKLIKWKCIEKVSLQVGFPWEADLEMRWACIFIKGCLALKSGNGGRHRNGKRETWNWNGSPTGSSRARIIPQSYWSWAEMAPHGSAIGCELPCKGAKGQLRQSSKGLIHQDCLLTASRKLKQKTRHRVCGITVLLQGACSSSCSKEPICPVINNIPTPSPNSAAQVSMERAMKFYSIIIKEKFKLLTCKSFWLKATSCTSCSLIKVSQARY